MRTLRNAVVAVFTAAATLPVAAAAAPDPVLDADPFTAEALLAKPQGEPGLRDYLEGVAAAARLDDAGAALHLRAAWSAPKVRPQIAQRALTIAGHVAFRAGRYGEAADLYDRAISSYDNTLEAAQRADLEQARGVALALRGKPAQTMSQATSGTLPLGRNLLGLTTAPLTINGHRQQAVIDTGANLSTLSATAAKLLGVKPAARDASVGSSTMKAVATHLGIADAVAFGPVTLHHVAFLVVDDAALSPLGPKSRIDVIVGFPILAALGRITFREKPDSTRELSFAPSLHAATPGNLRFDGFNAYVEVEALGMTLPFFVDSGANKTVFEKRFAAEHPDRLKGLAHKSSRVGGGGGIETRDTVLIPAADVRLGNASVPLKDMAIELGGNGSDSNYGTLGYDVLWARGGYTIDFGKLNLSLGGK